MSDLYDFLRKAISDESAYPLVTFFENLTSALESHYFAPMLRYQNYTEPPKKLPARLLEPPDSELPF